MQQKNLSNAKCRHCRFYEPEGRRGGCCQKLGVAVDATWSVCSLVSFPFEDNFKHLDYSLAVINKTLATLEEIVHLEKALSFSYSEHEHYQKITTNSQLK